LRCASPPRSQPPASSLPLDYFTITEALKKPNKNKREPPFLAVLSSGLGRPIPWRPPHARPSRRRPPPPRPAWLRATSSPPRSPCEGPQSPSARPRAAPRSRLAPRPSRPPPVRSAAPTDAPSHPGECCPSENTSYHGPIHRACEFVSPADSVRFVRASRKQARGLGAAALATASFGSFDSKRDGCLSCFPKSRRRGRSGWELARFTPCALPHASRLSGAKVGYSFIIYSSHIHIRNWEIVFVDREFEISSTLKKSIQVCCQK
jgi:hypothetical protein